MNRLRRASLACLLTAILCSAGRTPAAEKNPPARLSADEFEALHRLIKPQPGEAKWAAIPWLTNLHEARERAVAEDKPLLLWRAGGGDVLGRA
jgi:hypothetical protein